jgi:hypothetical protein
MPKSKAPTREATGAWNIQNFMGSRRYNIAGVRVGDGKDILIDDSRASAIVIGVRGRP